MSSLRGEIIQWVRTIMQAHAVYTARHFWVGEFQTPQARPVSRVIVDLCVTSSLTRVSSREPSHGVLPIWIGKMTNWCSKWENWTENCRHLLDITKRRLLFPSICNCLSASWQQCCQKLRIEKYSSASNWFLTVREWRYVIGSSQAAVFDCPVLRSHSIELSGILIWDARSGTNTLQKLDFWGARQLSKKSPVSW